MRASILLFLLLIFQHLFTTNAQAEANKLNYSTYYVTTYAPYLENPYYDSVAGYNSTGSNSSPNGLSTQLSTGTISGISGFNWGSSTVFTSGRSDNVAMKVDGYITWPGTAGDRVLPRKPAGQRISAGADLRGQGRRFRHRNGERDRARTDA